MVLYWVVVFTGLRAIFLDYVLLPFGQYTGIKTKKDQVRFAEQAWLVIDSIAFWSLGMVCNPSELYQTLLTPAMLVYYVLFRLLAKSEKSLDELAKPRN
jgi:hypothetical protein